MKSGKLKKVGAAFIAGISAVVVVGLITWILFPSEFDVFESKTYDSRFIRKTLIEHERRDGAVIDDVIIVDMDERSIDKLGRFSEWSRLYHADLIDFLSTAGATAIGFDVLFLEHGADADADSRLVRSVKNAGNVYFAVSFGSSNPDAFLPPMISPPPGLDYQRFSYAEHSRLFPRAERMEGEFTSLYNSAAGIGFSNHYPDQDGVVRSIPPLVNFGDALYPSFALSMALGLNEIDSLDVNPHHIRANAAISPQFDIPLDESGRLLINYQGPFRSFRYVSYWDVYAKRIPPDFFRDRVVLIGTSAAGLFDLRSVPVQNSFPGVEIHANLLHTITRGDYVRRLSLFSNLLIMITISVAIAMCTIFLPLRYSGMIIVALIFVTIYSTYLLFSHFHIWIELIRPLLSVMLSFFGIIGYRYVTEQKDKRRIKQMFQHYISTAVVDEILKRPDMLKLGGERLIATAFFSDIKDFTTYSEKSSPARLVALLNEYLSEMTEIVLHYGGYLDKYEGDAIVAIWGVPVQQEDHAIRACLAALDMQRRLRHLRKKWSEKEQPQFEIRIGINSGPMIAGNIGGRERFDYTAIGDSVNLASRLEGVNKVYNTEIIISEETREFVNHDLILRELDYIRVKGREQKVRIYEVLGVKDDPVEPEFNACLKHYSNGLEAYRLKRWVQAFDHFQNARKSAPDDGPSNELLRRCKFFIDNPDSDLKDGIFVMKGK
ncbi:MAG: adenylate/guanylate cyclase domain-containing protein [candidate division KSB1 bacterium]|jgi:adenylate cyclase|nr:adenylate/guanylate cyclase domain-containing protein [candidate division KSB1 bacterium]